MASRRRVFTDTLSGAKWTAQERAGLAEAPEFMRPGDTLGVWKLDRLGRSLGRLTATVTALQERGIGFKNLTEQIRLTSSGGKLIFHVSGALAEFERDLIHERTRAGLQAARARGRHGGRPQALYADKSNSVAEIVRSLNISKSTLYRYVKADKRR